MRSLVSVALALALATPTTALAALGPSDAEVSKLYVEGQARAEAKDYTGAADSWTRLLNMLDESPANQSIRESVILNALEAHINAYNLLVDEAGSKDITHLRKGKATLDEYYSSFKDVHGDRVAISSAVQAKATELDEALKEAEAAAKSKPPPPGPGTKDDPNEDPRPRESSETDDPKVVVLNAQNNGNGLIIGGAVVSALGIGALVMVPVGSARGKDAETRHTDASNRLAIDENDSEAQVDLQKALFDGEQANQILIAGAVLFPLLLAGGVTMIVFGVRAKQRFKRKQKDAVKGARLTPSFGRNFAGFSLSGRF